MGSSDDVGKKISLLIRKDFVFYWDREGVCAEREVTQEDSCKQT